MTLKFQLLLKLPELLLPVVPQQRGPVEVLETSLLEGNAAGNAGHDCCCCAWATPSWL